MDDMEYKIHMYIPVTWVLRSKKHLGKIMVHVMKPFQNK